MVHKACMAEVRIMKIVVLKPEEKTRFGGHMRIFVCICSLFNVSVCISESNDCMMVNNV
jgi:hypothetical protein